MAGPARPPSALKEDVSACKLVEGSTLRQDADDNKAIYGKDVTPQQILNGEVAPPASVNLLLSTWNKYSKAKSK